MGRRRIPIVVYVITLDALFLGGALYPLLGYAAWGAVAAVLAVVNGALLQGKIARLSRMDAALSRSAAAKNALLALSSLIVTLGGVELGVRLLDAVGFVEPYSAMRTVAAGKGEDFRLAHITADEYREPDPVLLWRPVARWPYTRQRFKGPVVEPDKPPGVFRVLCYGDSNTDGPHRGGWPERLQKVLERTDPGIDVEVLNAGVAGYSSHQGLLRFRREVGRFRPDLVLVSFGWNDAVATAVPDKKYRPPLPFVAGLQRLLLRYRFYRVALFYLRPPSPPPEELRPRVSRHDYLVNMQGFLETAREHGADVVFLTRPHVRLRDARDWRRRVPLYNRDLQAFGARTEARVVDAEAYFLSRPVLLADECHFTPEGHEEMALLIAGALRDGGR